MQPKAQPEETNEGATVQTTNEREFERQLRDVARALAHILNTPAVLFTSAMGSASTMTCDGPERISTVLGTRGPTNYAAVHEHYQRMVIGFHYACELHYPLCAVADMTCDMKPGSNIDLSELVETIYYAREAYNDKYEFHYQAGRPPLTMGAMCSHLRKACGMDAKEWVRDSLKLALSTYVHSKQSPSEFERNRLLRSIAISLEEVVLSMVVHWSAANASKYKEAFRKKLMVQLDELYQQAEERRCIEFRRRLSAMHASLDTLQTLATAKGKQAIQILEDDAAHKMLCNPPPIVLHTLSQRKAKIECHLEELLSAFDDQYPIELRTSHLLRWQKMYASYVVNACVEVRSALDKAPSFPPAPPAFSRIEASCDSCVFLNEGDEAEQLDMDNVGANEVPLPAMKHTHCNVKYTLPLVHTLSLYGECAESVMRIIEVLQSMIENEDVQLFHCNASYVRSIAMIMQTDQQYVVQIMRNELDSYTHCYNVDSVTNAHEMRNWDLGEYAERLAEACSMLQSLNLVKMHEFWDALFDGRHDLRPTPTQSSARLLLNKVGLHVGSILEDTQHLSRRFIARAIAMVFPPLIHMRTHRHLMRNLTLGISAARPTASDTLPILHDDSEWNDAHRSYFEYMCTNETLRTLLLSKFHIMCASMRVPTPEEFPEEQNTHPNNECQEESNMDWKNGGDKHTITLTHAHLKRIPLAMAGWLKDLSTHRPEMISFSHKHPPKRSFAAYKDTPVATIHLQQLFT